jgi:[acyl-carrier-protein] S-malonyltransferase
MGHLMKVDLNPLMPDAALAFRGYNVTNLGRSRELLNHADYGPIVREYLSEAASVCEEVTGRPVDLIERLNQQREATLDDYAEAITLIVAMEQAQLRLLAEFHGTDYHRARVSFGFSLGEISALVAGGVYTMRDALKIPLAMADDCVELGHDVTMGIVFSKGEAIPMEKVRALLLSINAEGQGVLGVSAYLSPNSFLVLGTTDTVLRMRTRLDEVLPRLHVRLNDHRWPPLHTPIIWEKCIPNRAAKLLHTLPGGLCRPQPDVLSMVTGTACYDEYNSREIIGQWVDHTQRLWDVLNSALASGIEAVIHVGPEPNIIPATFDRLAANVELQTRGSRRMRAASVVARRPWLQNLLPRRATLLRAPLIKHVLLEDWLLESE